MCVCMCVMSFVCKTNAHSDVLVNKVGQQGHAFFLQMRMKHEQERNTRLQTKYQDLERKMTSLTRSIAYLRDTHRKTIASSSTIVKALRQKITNLEQSASIREAKFKQLKRENLLKSQEIGTQPKTACNRYQHLYMHKQPFSWRLLPTLTEQSFH